MLCFAGGQTPELRREPDLAVVDVLDALNASTKSRHALNALQDSLWQERRAQQELVYTMSTRVLDPLQFCTAANSLFPHQCDLQPLLEVMAMHEE
jgi:hypothetical protein